MTEVKKLKPEWIKTKVKYEFKNLDYLRKPISSVDRGKMQKRIYDYYGASGVIDKVDDYLFDEPLILVGEDGENLRSRSTALAFLAKGKYWVNNHAHILKPSHGELDFLLYKMESLDFYPYITGSAQPKLTRKNLDNIPLKVPNLIIQQQIASFLNQKISEIDALISDKEKLIALLEEKRQATITEVVTKGLNPDLKMKDSGVEWIGEIPEHWGIIKLKYLFNIRTGGTPKSNNLEYWDDKGIIWITPGDLSFPGDTISDSYKKISESGLINSSANYISKNSIVISTRAPIGNMKIATMEYTTNQGCKSLESKNENHNIIYYFNLLRYRKNVLESLGQGTTFLELSSNSLKEFEVPVMNKEEQDRIVEVIQSLNNISDKLLVQINKQIYKLKEYRQALIYEAVTGKIDVQEMVKETEQEEVSPL